MIILDRNDGILLTLPLEIWIYIFNFLSLRDIFKFKFLSRNSNSIYFNIGYEKGLNFIIENSRMIFDTNEYYRMIKYFFVEEFIKRIKKQVNFCDRLFIKFCLENFLSMTTISNTLFHLFYCPRSFFASSNCKVCSRIYQKKDLLIFPFPNLLYLKVNEYTSEYDFNFLWSDENQREIINSDIKRCLNISVIQKSVGLLPLFVEIQGRYYCNFFMCLVDFLDINSSEKKNLLKISSKLFNNYICYILKNVNLNVLESMFQEIEINQFQYLKVINEKYKKYLQNKYEN